MQLHYDKTAKRFWFTSSVQLSYSGLSRGVCEDGYLYSFDDWYPFNAQMLRNLEQNIDEYGADAAARKAAIEQTETLVYQSDLVDRYREHFKMTPYPYQEEVIKRMFYGDKYLCAIEQGMGKTFMAYMSVLLHKLEGKPYRTLVVCPKIVMLNWVQEVRANTDLSIRTFYGNTVQRARVADELQHSDWDIVVTTFDTIIERSTALSSETLYRAWMSLTDAKRREYIARWMNARLKLGMDELTTLLAPAATRKDQERNARILKKVPDRFLPLDAVALVQEVCNSENTLSNLGLDILIVDEASRCLSSDSSRSIVIEKLAQRIPKVFLLSGTLCVGRPTDLHEPCNILSRHILDMSNTEFNTRFVRYRRSSRHLIEGYKNVDSLKLITDPYVITKTREGERLQLPDRLFDKISCCLGRHAAELYNAVLQHDEIALPNGTVTMPLLAQKINKCQQICNGFLYLDLDKTKYCGRCDRLNECITSGIQPGTGECINSDIPKEHPYITFRTDKEEALRLFAQLRKDAREKFIVWAWFTPDIIRIKNVLTSLGIRYVTPSDKNCVNAFNDSTSDILAFVGQEKQGIGITLNTATYTLYWSYGMDMEARSQSLDRNYRIGQTIPVTVVDLVTPGTVEEDILWALKHKERVRDFVQAGASCMFCEFRDACEVCGQYMASSKCRMLEEARVSETKPGLKLKPVVVPKPESSAS